MRKLLICGLAASMFVVPLALPGMPDSAVETDRWGCVIRVNPASPEVHLVFSADSMFEGGAYALDVLDSAGVKGSFFSQGISCGIRPMLLSYAELSMAGIT